MFLISLRAFRDEFEKIAATLSAEQLLRLGEKAGKRGWDAAREAKSIRRLMSRDVRPASAAAAKTEKTVAGRFPARGMKLEPTVLRKAPTQTATAPATVTKPKSLAWKAGVGAAGAVGIGFGSQLGKELTTSKQPQQVPGR